MYNNNCSWFIYALCERAAIIFLLKQFLLNKCDPHNTR